jgi:hypothetical protein
MKYVIWWGLYGFYKTAKSRTKKDLMDYTDFIVLMDNRCIFIFA